MVQFTAWLRAIRHGLTRHGTTRHAATLHGATLHGATLHGAIRLGAIRLGAILVCVTGVVAATAAPAVAAQGVQLQITQVARQFGAGSTTVAVVASKDSGDDCLKVRWSLIVQVQGIRLDQIRVTRFEETGAFPVDVRTSGQAARFTDTQPDPGTLCRDSTVTARYALVFADDVNTGLLQLTAEAYDVNLRLLQRTAAVRTVAGAARSAQPVPDPTVAPQVVPVPTAIAVSPLRTEDPTPGLGASASNDPGLLTLGLAVGGMLFFAGFGLLLRTFRRRPHHRAGLGRWIMATRSR